MHGQEVFEIRQCGVMGVTMWVVNLFLVWVFVGGRIGLICLPFFAGEGVPGIQVVWSTPKFKWLGHPFLFFTWVGPCQFKCKGTPFCVLHGLVHVRLDYPVCGALKHVN